MQLVAATMPCENEPANNRMDALAFKSYNVARKYETAKGSLISSLIFKGISHSHYVDSYIIITNKAKSEYYK